MALFYNIKNKPFQYFLCVFSVVSSAFILSFFIDIIGYRTVALFLLFIVSMLAIFCDVYPVLTAAVLSALLWDFFFIPPHHTFHVNNAEDALMLIMYFIIALLNGVLTTRIRRVEMLSGVKEKNISSINLYNTLFNSIAHELKTPISTIFGSTENLLDNTDKLNEAHKKMLIAEIHQASERLNNLVGNLLDISRLEAGYIHIKKDWCNINELVFSVIESLQRNIVKHKVKVEIDEQLPLVKIDYGLMEQVVSNIVQNATLYTVENTSITIQVSVIENELKIRIFDNGSGVPDNEIDKIFDKFYSIKGKTINRTGLGLSIAKGFVEAHNGIIKAYNNEFGGLTFDISIPLSNNEIMNINTIE